MTFPKVLRTKITPPRRSARTLARPRLQAALVEALQYRLSILQAGAGYGKSTALAALLDEVQPLIWYTVSEEDADPLIFLLHLCHATQAALPQAGGLPTGFLESWDVTRGPLPAAGVVDEYLNAVSLSLHAPALLILDDAHHLASAVDGPAETALLLDRLISLAPPDLHILLSVRLPVQLPNLYRWRAQGQVLTLDQSLLAFTPDEIQALFARHYHYELTAKEIERIYSVTEGWAIALHLMWQNLRSGSDALAQDGWLRPAGSLEGLFEILASEVFDRQPEDVQEFLLISATLREMTPEACDALRGAGDSAAMLNYLKKQELFVVDLAEAVEMERRPVRSSLRLRYHLIFHNFLDQAAGSEKRRTWHLRAGVYFQGQEDLETAIYHLLKAEDLEGAATLLDSYGAALLAAGRLDTLSAYLDLLPPAILRAHPALLSHLGDLARLHSRFEEALGWYAQAETLWRERSQPDGIARALRGQARVYLDTVNPSRAEELLERVTHLTDGFDDREAQARLYELLAENKLNSGKIEDAERLSRQAEMLRNEGPSHSQLRYRVLLRTGRLQEARRELEACAETERRRPVATPRAHRETLLLLSLVYSFMGRAEEAAEAAQEGTRRGIELNSPFITAVGHMRQGHALMLLAGNRDLRTFTPGPGAAPAEYYTLARAQFLNTIDLSQTLSVSRLTVEARWGLCRAHGFQGDLVQALQAAQQALEVAVQAGDEWIASLIRLTMGASYALAVHYEEAEVWLNRAVLSFQECSDTFGLCAARLWLCLVWRRQKNELRLAQTLPEVLAACRDNRYDFLLARPTLLGPPSERAFVPLLLLAVERGWESGYALQLLERIGLARTSLHPGFQLRIKTLGSFMLWRGDEPVPPSGWRREKARQLFQLLLTHRGAALDRDQIAEYLWPGQDPAAMQRNFKVTLNTLYQVLEPDREAGQESAFICREGTSYSLRAGADIWMDAEVFREKIAQAEAALESQPDRAAGLMVEAVRLYEGEYLPEARYETWSAIEREHLAVLFLRTADRLADLMHQRGRYQETVQVCQQILSFDNCWERAYQRLMLAYDRLGDHGQVARTYQRCQETLHAELDVAPAPETERLYHQLTRDR